MVSVKIVNGKIFFWKNCLTIIVIFLDFHSTKHGLLWLILGHMALTKIKCIPDVLDITNEFSFPQ